MSVRLMLADGARGCLVRLLRWTRSAGPRSSQPPARTFQVTLGGATDARFYPRWFPGPAQPRLYTGVDGVLRAADHRLDLSVSHTSLDKWDNLFVITNLQWLAHCNSWSQARKYQVPVDVLANGRSSKDVLVERTLAVSTT